MNHDPVASSDKYSKTPREMRRRRRRRRRRIRRCLYYYVPRA
jgi:hypothetical protein